MPNRFIRRLGFWMSAYLLAAATGSVVMAEAPVRAEEGKVNLRVGDRVRVEDGHIHRI
jgi:hypothetical protein